MTKRVFLSFKMENKKQVDGVRLLAWSKNVDLDFYDESVRVAYKSTDAAYIKGKISEKIRRASVTVCFLDKETHQSQWVNWELEKSIEFGNRIILMGLPNGPQRLTVPEAVRGHDWYLWDVHYLSKLIDG